MLWCLNRGSKMGIPIKVYLSFNLASSAPFRGHLPLTLSLASLCHTNAPYRLHYLCSLHMYISICSSHSQPCILWSLLFFPEHISTSLFFFFLLSISVKQRRLLPHALYSCALLLQCHLHSNPPAALEVKHLVPGLKFKEEQPHYSFTFSLPVWAVQWMTCAL